MENSRQIKEGTLLNGKYRVESILGEGGFGITYLARDININEIVAVKEYFPSTLGTRDTTSVDATNEITIIRGSDIEAFERGVKRFEEEASNLAKFNKESGIVSVKNFFKENNTGYMVMEYIEGETLKDYLIKNGGKLPFLRVIELLSPVMESLSLIHKSSIVHRDISPDNIMVTKDGKLKLIDFGASRYVGINDDKSLTVMLKAGFAPPEQYSTNGNQGPWTDVYALSATMYQMMSGEVPVESVERVMGEDKLIDLNKKCRDVPDYIAKAIRKGMELDVSTRYKNVAELKEALVKKSNNKRVTIMTISLVAALLLAIAVSVIVLWPRNGNEPIERRKCTESDKEVIEEIESEKVVDLEEMENALVEKLKKEISGEVVETFFGDFNGDGEYEIWAEVWGDEGVPYGFDYISSEMDQNPYNLEFGKEYRQLQIWYVDDAKAYLMDDFTSIILTEEYVNGNTTYWGEDTFYYLPAVEAKMIQFGKKQQLAVIVYSTWMTGRGWGIYVDQTVTLYGNDNGPEIYLKEYNEASQYGEDETTAIAYKFRDGALCISETEFYSVSDKDYYTFDEDYSASYDDAPYSDTDLYYPIYYVDGKYFEQASVEIEFDDIRRCPGFQEIYDAAMLNKLHLFRYETGSAANVIRNVSVDHVQFDQYLYNDSGYIYLNGKAGGMEDDYAWGLYDYYYVEPDICLEMRIEEGVITSYRWIGQRQSMSLSDFELITSDFSSVSSGQEYFCGELNEVEDEKITYASVQDICDFYDKVSQSVWYCASEETAYEDICSIEFGANDYFEKMIYLSSMGDWDLWYTPGYIVGMEYWENDLVKIKAYYSNEYELDCYDVVEYEIELILASDDDFTKTMYLMDYEIINENSSRTKITPENYSSDNAQLYEKY